MQEDVYQGDGLNLYAYCSNNPVVYYDPSGYKKGSNSGCPPASNNGGDGGAPEADGSGSETVTYRRVQGGTGDRSSQQRVLIDGDGNVYINNKNANLNLSIDSGEHSQYYIEHNRPGADIYEFEVPTWLDDMVQDNCFLSSTFP